MTGLGIWIRYRNSKSHLGIQEVFVPEPGSSILTGEVAEIRRITAPLAEKSSLDYLLLQETWSQAHKSRLIRPLTLKSFALWLNGRTTLDDHILTPGFIHKYNVTYGGEYYPIQGMQARHTNAHKAYMGGASYQDVGDYLHHKRVQEGVSSTTGVYLHGQARIVEQLREMHAKRVVTGKALPLLSNKEAKVRALGASDLALWRDQGMLVLPTHYGFCIIPDAYGPCVCGDPCYIGPIGDGCDYALYTPESRKSLEEDAATLKKQLGDIQSRNPRHPQIGQIETRIARIDKVLSDIAIALERQALGEVPGGSRQRQVPEEPTFGRANPQLPLERRQRQQHRLRAAALPTSFKSHASMVMVHPLDPEQMEVAEAIIASNGASRRQITPEGIARRVGVPTARVLASTALIDRISAHNARCLLPTIDSVRERLRHLEDLGQEARYDEFAEMYGVQRSRLPRVQPEVCTLVAEHNKTIRRNKMRSRVEGRIAEVKAANAILDIDDLARELHADVVVLRRDARDLLGELKHHNSLVRQSLQQTSLKQARRLVTTARKQRHELHHDQATKGTGLQDELNQESGAELGVQHNRPTLKSHTSRRRVEEEDVALAFSSLSRKGSRMSMRKLAQAVGISDQSLGVRFPQWAKRCTEHNLRAEQAALEQAWIRMEQTPERVWTQIRFASEAGMDHHKLCTKHADWVVRLESSRTQISQTLSSGQKKLEVLVEEQLHSQRPTMPRQIAAEAGVDGRTFANSPINAHLYYRYMEHLQACYKPILVSALDAAKHMGRALTLKQLVDICDFPSVQALTHYFPEIVSKVKATRHESWESLWPTGD